MPIDSTTTIYELRLRFPGYVPAGGVQASVQIGAYRTLPVPQTAYGTFDVNNSEVAEVISRVKAGTIPVVYIIDGDGYLQASLGDYTGKVRDDQLPAVYHHLRNEHPFHPDFNADALDYARGPFKSIHYRRDAGILVNAPTSVDFTIHEDPAFYRQRISQAGWPEVPPTGTDALYSTVGTFGRSSNGSAYSTYTLPEVGDVEWSIDGGFNWLTTPPTDFGTVTNTRYRTGTDWIEIRPEEAEENNNPWRQVSPRSLVATPPGGQQAISISGASLADMYRIGIQMDVVDANQLIRSSGEAWRSTHRITGDEHPYGLQLVPPAELSNTTPSIPYRYLIAQHQVTGDVNLLHTGIAPNNAALVDYHAAYLTFAGFPVSVLSLAVTDAATTLHIDMSAQFANGETIYVDDEQMTIDSGVGSASVTVTRGVNGTTAAAHAMDATVRGTVDDDQLRYVHIWDEGNTLAANTRLTVVCLRKV